MLRLMIVVSAIFIFIVPGCTQEPAGQSSSKADKKTQDKAAKATIPELTKMLKASEAATRAEAARILAQQGEAAAEAVPALMEAIRKEQNDWVMYGLARALGKIGAPAVAPLAQALLDMEVPARNRAAIAGALGQIDPTDAKAALPALRQAAENDPRERVRNDALRAIENIAEEEDTEDQSPAAP